MRRPSGVTLISLLDFLVALGISVLGILLFVVINPSSPGIFPKWFIAGAGSTVAFFCFLFAGLVAILGWALWRLKNWARITQIICNAFDLMLTGTSSIAVLSRFKLAGLFLILVRIGIDTMILWYLNQSHVVIAYRRVATDSRGAAAFSGSRKSQRG